MKKRIQILWLIGAVALFALPLPASLLLREHLDTRNYEKRVLAEAPRIGETRLLEFPEKFDAWFNDHLPFRNELIASKSMLGMKLFHHSVSDKVILGRDGYLFYNGAAAGDGDPIADYEGRNLFTEEQLQQIESRLVSQQEMLTSQGIEFVLFIAPNKENIYQDKMPQEYGARAEVIRADQVYERLKDKIHIVYPEQELKRFRQGQKLDLYYRTDTHWNQLGGYVGAKAILDSLQIPCQETTVLQPTAIPTTPGDLADLLNITPYLDEDVEYKLQLSDAVQLSEQSKGNEVIRYSNSEKIVGKALVVRDSFGFNLALPLASGFKETVFYEKNYYEPAFLQTEQPDVVIWELVERGQEGLRDFDIIK